jgi:hypothetical protein
MVKAEDWERRKTQIQKRHPLKDVRFYHDTKTLLWTIETACRQTGEVKIVATRGGRGFYSTDGDRTRHRCGAGG